MKKFLFTLLISIAPLVAMAQSQEEIIREIDKISSSISSLECDFVQTKHLSMLNDKMVSRGKMYYSQPSMLRWEYITPYDYVFLLNANQVLLKNSQREDVIDVDKNKIFKEIARLMMNSIKGSCLSDSDTFDVAIRTVGGEWVAELTPLKRDMKQMWTKLIIHFDRAACSVTKVEMREPSGDYNIIELSGIRQNEMIDASLFSIN